MKRRTVVLGMLGVAAAGGTAATLLLRRPAALHELPCGDETLPIRLEELAVDPDAMRRVGRAVLAAEGSPGEEELVARLFDTEGWSAACRDGAAAVLRERVRADLRDGRIVRVRGWILSRTEADLCALVTRVRS